MKKITFLLIALFAFSWQINSQVAIGAGNLQTENAPFEPFFGYSYTQTVYLASEINASGDITGLQWYYSGTTDLSNCQDLVIYLAESSRTEFASTTDWEPVANLTQVYAGGITVTAGVEGWTQITFDTPFTYSGTGNLIVAVDENMDGFNASGDDFFNSQVTTNRTISYFSDGTNPNPASPPTASNIDDTLSNVILEGITQACPSPSALTATNITANGADLAWTENGGSSSWNVEIVTAGTPPTGTPTASGVTNPYPASSLTAITSYEFYVQADCGSEQSSWVGPFSFTTLCDVFVPDYLATFDTFLQDCWDEADSGDPTTGPGDFGNSAWGVDGLANNGTTGAYDINLWLAAKSDWLLSPQFDLTGGPFQVELDLAIMTFGSNTTAGTLGSDDQVQVLITTDNGTTWTPIMSWDNTTVNPVGGDHFVYDLTAYSGMTVQFGIWASEGTTDDAADNEVSVDNFQVRNIPSCLEPSGLAVANITSNGADLSWTANGGEALWNVEIVTAGTPPTGTPTATGVTNPYPASGLSAITTYDYYVQADCGGSGLSSWTGPFSFTTLCDVFVPDYLATFDTFLQDCWDEADSGDPTIGPGDFGNSAWGVDGFANNGTTGAYDINLWLAAKSDWLLSPQFDLTGGPFQVELDLAIMTFGSSTTAGTLGSDDQVQVLITSDNGVTWTPILSWDNTSVVPAGGDHFVYDLTAYSGMTVQFGIWASEGTTDDAADNEVSVDNFQVRNIPTCLEPSGLTATNLSLTSTEVSWVDNAGASLWNIEYGEVGFVQGTGTMVNDVNTNPYVLSPLTSDTLYEFYVQANCDANGLSSWTGPFSFYTGYCESDPSSNDGQGVTNVTIGVTDFPSFGDFTYENHTATPVNVFQGIQTNMSITFATGYTYDTNIWIDFNDDLVFDASELVFQGESTNANPTTLDATFTMPATAPIGEHRMRIGTSDFGQVPPNPCYNGSFGVTLDFTVNIQMLNCTLAEAEYSTVVDCDNDQFFIDVNIISMGDATSLEISNDLDATTTQATATGVYQIGPFAFGSSVKAIITNEQDNDCVISSGTFTLLACPPDNDNPCQATIASVNDNETCDILTPGTILAASASGVPNGSCTGNPDDDVWFEFTALNEVQLISLVNISGGTTNLDHGVYEGTCDGLVELYCSPDAASITPELVVGNTYYIRVFSAVAGEETSTFDLCIKEAPDNTVCENASPFCGEGGALYGSNVIGIPNNTSVACLGTIPNPSWNILQIGETGPINIQITQNTEFDDNGNPIGQGLDVDFVLWGPFDNTINYCELDLLVDCPSCPFSNIPDNGFYPFGDIVDCSYSAAPVEIVTIDNAIAGEIYVLLVTNFSDDPGTIQIEQTNAGDTGAGGVTSEIEVDLGADQSFCGFPSYELNADSPFADRYEWYADGFIIDGETGSTLTVTETNTYTVIAYDENCDAQAQDTIVVIFGNEPVANPVDDMVTCDDASGDEVEDFDLESQTAIILGAQDPTVFNVTYHLTLVDAQTNTGALASPYNNISNPQTIYVRVEDANATFCFVTSSFDLIISGPTPTATSVDIEVCDDDADGIADFDLAAHDANVLNGQDDTIFTVSYYETEANAEAGTGAIDTTVLYSSTTQTIYARVESNVAFDCYSVVDFDLVVNELPNTTFTSDFEYEVCPNATVPVIITATANNYTAAEVSISWYHDGGLITGESGLTLPVLLAGTYSIEVTNNNSGCTTSEDIEIIELEQCIIPQGISPNGDQWNQTFDLSSFDVSKLEIFNRNGTLVYSKKNYTNEWHGQSNKGEQLPVGTYFYTMEYQNGKRKSAWVYINE